MSLELLFILAAAVCFLLAAFGVSSRIGLVPLGLFFWVMTFTPWI